MEKTLRQKDLADFVRRRRDLAPPPEDRSVDPRRRAKGLRRSEVASRVGISVEHYTHLEQGRADAISSQVLQHLAEVLELKRAETEHLFALAGKPLPEDRHVEDAAVPEPLRRFLEAQCPSPGYIIDHHWDALAWNLAAQALLYDFAALPRKRRNVLLQVFTDPTFREKVDDWEGHARTVLRFFRRDFGQSPADPRIREVVAELERTSGEFRAWWPLQEVDDHVSVRFVYTRPGDVKLVFDRMTLLSPEKSRPRIVIFLPVPNTGTEQQAARLIADHRARRSIG